MPRKADFRTCTFECHRIMWDTKYSFDPLAIIYKYKTLVSFETDGRLDLDLGLAQSYLTFGAKALWNAPSSHSSNRDKNKPEN